LPRQIEAVQGDQYLLVIFQEGLVPHELDEGLKSDCQVVGPRERAHQVGGLGHHPPTPQPFRAPKDPFRRPAGEEPPLDRFNEAHGGTNNIGGGDLYGREPDLADEELVQRLPRQGQLRGENVAQAREALLLNATVDAMTLQLRRRLQGFGGGQAPSQCHSLLLPLAKSICLAHKQARSIW